MNNKDKRKNTIEELTNKIQEGVKEVFNTGKYKEFLQSISNLYNFSVRNIVLAKAQNPNVTKIAGYRQWEQQGRQVQKGERAIKILAPTLRKTKKLLTDEKGKPKLDEKGEKLTEDVKYVSFVPVSVFDVEQTRGEPIPYLGSLTNNVKAFQELKQTLISLSPVPVVFDDIGINGKYQPFEKKIIIKENLPEQAMIRTLSHEIAHAKMEHGKTPENFDRNLAEVQAESISYIICQHLGIETEPESFSYIYSWSRDKETPELLSSLDIIQKISHEILSQIDEKFLTLEHEKEFMEIPTTKLSNNDLLTEGKAIDVQKENINIINSITDFMHTYYPEQNYDKNTIKEMVSNNDHKGISHFLGGLATTDEQLEASENAFLGITHAMEQKDIGLQTKIQAEIAEDSALHDAYDYSQTHPMHHPEDGDDITPEERSGDDITPEERKISASPFIEKKEARQHIAIYNGEPVVQIFSETSKSEFGAVLPLTLADTLLKNENENEHFPKRISYTIFSEMNNQIKEYEGQYEYGEKGTLIEQIAKQEDLNSIIDTFIPYLKSHETIGNMEKIGQKLIAEKSKGMNMPYGEYLVSTAAENRTLLNQGKLLKNVLSEKHFIVQKTNNKIPIKSQINKVKNEVDSKNRMNLPPMSRGNRDDR